MSTNQEPKATSNGGPKGPTNIPIVSCDASQNSYPSNSTAMTVGVNWGSNTAWQPVPDSGTTMTFTYFAYPYLDSTAVVAPKAESTADILTPTPTQSPIPAGTPTASPALTASYWTVSFAYSSMNQFPYTGGPANTGVGAGSNNASDLTISIKPGSTTTDDFMISGNVTYKSGGVLVTVALGPTIVHVVHG